jgi:rhodanese-related sulfurtransferase
MAAEETERILTPQQAQEMLAGGDVQLVDVREPHEWDAGRIAGATHIELESLVGRAGEIDKDRKVLFYCRVGRRSVMATEAFANSGYDAYDLGGGITAWVEAGLPIEPEDGEVAARGVSAKIEATDFGGQEVD